MKAYLRKQCFLMLVFLGDSDAGGHDVWFTRSTMGITNRSRGAFFGMHECDDRRARGVCIYIPKNITIIPSAIV